MKRLALLLASACLLFGTAASAADFGADRHVARGLECASCHGPDMKNPETPDENTCLKCHNRDQIAEKPIPASIRIRIRRPTTATARSAICSMSRKKTTALSATSSTSR